MNLVLEAAQEVCAFMNARDWRYCLIGGLAVQHWGKPRTTLDADFTLLTGWGDEERYIQEILAHFQMRAPDAAAFALRYRVLLVRASNGVDLDISLGALPFEEEMVARAREVLVGESLKVRCCTAEDLFVMKTFASRPRDWSDAEAIVARQTDLDRNYIIRHLTALCELKETPEIVQRAKLLLGVTP